MAAGDGASRLWLRSLATTTAQSLSGTEGATFPFWSPDGRAIGFFAENALKRLDLETALCRVLAPILAGRGGTWNADDVIVVARRQHYLSDARVRDRRCASPGDDARSAASAAHGAPLLSARRSAIRFLCARHVG